nr:hypothetical protein [Entamoeba invadens]
MSIDYSMLVDLTFICARDVPCFDSMSSNPYIKFYINKTSYETRCKMMTTEPDYNYTQRVTLIPSKTVTFQFYTWHLLTSNDMLGCAKWEVPPLMNDEFRYYLLQINPRGYLLFSAKCISRGISSLQILQQISPERKTLLQIKVKPIVGLERAISQEFGLNKFIARIGNNMKIAVRSESMRARTGVTKLVLFNYIKNCLSQSQTLYVEARVGETLSISLHLFDKIKSEGDGTLIASTQYVVPDFYENEKTSVKISGDSGTGFDFEIQCLESVYHHVRPELIPPLNDVYSNTEFPCEIDIEKLKKFDGLMWNTNYLFPAAEICYKGKVYSTSWMYSETFDETSHYPDGWFQGFIIPICVNTEFVVRIKFRERNSMEEIIYTEKKMIWPEMEENKSSKKIRVMLEGEKKLILRMKRIREVSSTFRRKFIDKTEDPLLENRDMNTAVEEVPQIQGSVTNIKEQQIKGFSPFN